MRILLIHQNFPGQFKHLGPALAQAGHQVQALTWGNAPPTEWRGVQLHHYQSQRSSSSSIHPWLSDLETKVIRAEACLQALRRLDNSALKPDVVVAHPGWGESLFIKDLWSTVPLGLYSEFYYAQNGADVGFDPEFANIDPLIETCRIKLKNVNNLLHLQTADAGISPTHWQASTFPEPFRSQIEVVHDGIDTNQLISNSEAKIQLSTTSGNKLELSRAHEVITFVNRNLEPYRGFHIFMRSLPALLRDRPNAHILIVGGNDVSYGSKPDPERYGASSWRDIFAAEVRPAISDADWQRVHFLGRIPYPVFVQMLQVSSVHVYLTYPFVLSWSLLEAMSIGCAIVASDTSPVREVIEHDHTGRLVDFFDHEQLAASIILLLNNPAERERLGRAARAHAVAHYDLHSHCLPRQIAWVEQLSQQH